MAKMTTKKTGIRTKTKRTGTKTRAKRTAGKTARAGAGRHLPRTPKGWAEQIEKREAKRPGFFRAVMEAMKGGPTEYRAAQVEPRASEH